MGHDSGGMWYEEWTKMRCCAPGSSALRIGNEVTRCSDCSLPVPVHAMLFVCTGMGYASIAERWTLLIRVLVDSGVELGEVTRPSPAVRRGMYCTYIAWL